MKKIIIFLLLIFSLSSCRSYEVTSKNFDSSKEIIILYTNNSSTINNPDDYYLNVENIKNNLLNTTPNVTLIDTGNAIDSSNGKYNSYIDVMNKAGYDYSILGINDFSNGLDYLYQNINRSSFKYIFCNMSYSGQKKDIFKKTVPFEVVDYDGIKVGYIGVENPMFIEKQPNYFMEDDGIVVNFYNETPEVFFDTVQCSISKAKELGAEYIVLISNLDLKAPNVSDLDYSLEDLVGYIKDANIVINSNDDKVLNNTYLKDADNNDVFVVLNGSNNSNFGSVVINNGTITTDVY